MKTFIRFDVKGTFRGSDHVSTFADDSFEEAGISCYQLDAEGVQKLMHYWTHQMMSCREDFAEMNLTVFAGELVGTGTDFEDCATCTETLAEIDGAEWYDIYFELQERVWDDEITEDEMYVILENRIKEAIA